MLLSLIQIVFFLLIKTVKLNGICYAFFFGIGQLAYQGYQRSLTTFFFLLRALIGPGAALQSILLEIYLSQIINSLAHSRLDIATLSD